MKKIIALAFSLILSLSLVANVSAADNEKENNTSNDVSCEDLQKMNDFIKEYAPLAKRVSGDSDVLSSWEIAKTNNIIFVNSTGHFELYDNARDFLGDGYDAFLGSVNFSNELVDMKLVQIDPESLEIKSLELTQEALEAMDEHSPSSYAIVPFSGSHCDYPGLHVNILVENNMYEIMEYLFNCASTGMDDPYFATVGYWVNKVRENGQWDYKITGIYDGYNKTICCTYARGVNIHKTCEWLGNYNYGYTGSSLFNLPILEAGSFGVSGFRRDDIYTDWPAIVEGYEDSQKSDN